MQKWCSKQELQPINISDTPKFNRNTDMWKLSHWHIIRMEIFHTDVSLEWKLSNWFSSTETQADALKVCLEAPALVCIMFSYNHILSRETVQFCLYSYLYFFLSTRHPTVFFVNGACSTLMNRDIPFYNGICELPSLSVFKEKIRCVFLKSLWELCNSPLLEKVDHFFMEGGFLQQNES